MFTKNTSTRRSPFSLLPLPHSRYPDCEARLFSSHRLTSTNTTNAHLHLIFYLCSIWILITFGSRQHVPDFGNNFFFYFSRFGVMCLKNQICATHVTNTNAPIRAVHKCKGIESKRSKETIRQYMDKLGGEREWLKLLKKYVYRWRCVRRNDHTGWNIASSVRVEDAALHSSTMHHTQTLYFTCTESADIESENK